MFTPLCKLSQHFVALVALVALVAIVSHVSHVAVVLFDGKRRKQGMHLLDISNGGHVLVQFQVWLKM